jgi:hypothetical protein
MAGSVTTAMPTSEKAEFADAYHCFLATATPTGNLTNTSTAIASLSSSAGLCHGMPVSGTGVPSATFLLNNAGTWLLSKAATATNSGVTLTCTGDVFYMALINSTLAGNVAYGAATTNYGAGSGTPTQANLGTDEVANGSGYTTGGVALTANVSPATSGTGAYWSWSSNPSWTSATFSVAGSMIYNSSWRAPTNNRVNAVNSFGGTQTVTSGTFTVILPTNAVSTSILQIN